MKSIKLVLFEPEMPTNIGATIRTCACFDVEIGLIEPFSPIWGDKGFKRAKMDYVTHTTTYESFQSFMNIEQNRKILFTPHAQISMVDFRFQPGDILIFGRESNGVDDYVAKQIECHVRIPMVANCRSLNLSISCGIVIGFALSQLQEWCY